ncbi:unnamed protein product [Cylicocyclus nassatus]|uniref:Uncharacterized protein n=1 Tax=Cylicocyclus nassatus TaxID=53992 RepID=A0AA36M0W9_CYLNA|nr:unnamed protein product [Cylicocyclus nassatus]
MRIFNLTFLLLTILVILSAVDVGECGVIGKFKEIAGKVVPIIGTVGTVVRTGVDIIKKFKGGK